MPPKATPKPGPQKRGFFTRLLFGGGKQAEARQDAGEESESSYTDEEEEDVSQQDPRRRGEPAWSSDGSDSDIDEGVEHKILVTSIDHYNFEDGVYFNFSCTDVPGLYPGLTQTLRAFVRRTKEELKIKVFATTNGGSTGSAHGRRQRLEEAAAGDWKVGDIIEYELVELVAGSSERRIGLVFTELPPCRVLVDRVIPDTWAARAGFRPNDEIVEINGYLASYLSEDRFKSEMARRPLRLALAAMDGSLNNRVWPEELMEGTAKWSGKNWVTDINERKDEVERDRERLRFMQNPDVVLTDIFKAKLRAAAAAKQAAELRVDEVEQTGFVEDEEDKVDTTEVVYTTWGPLGLAFHGLPPVLPTVVGINQKKIHAAGVRIGSELIEVNSQPVKELPRRDLVQALKARPVLLKFRRAPIEKPYRLPHGMPLDLRQHTVMRPLRGKLGLPLLSTFEIEVTEAKDVLGFMTREWPPARHIHISSVLPGSAAHRQGVEVDDVVIAVCGRATEDMTAKEMDELLSSRPCCVLLARAHGGDCGWGTFARKFGENAGALGIIPTCLSPDLPIVKTVVRGTVGDEAGVRAGDAVFSVNGVMTLLMTRAEYSEAMLKRPVTLYFLRGSGLEAAANAAAVERVAWGEAVFETHAFVLGLPTSGTGDSLGEDHPAIREAHEIIKETLKEPGDTRFLNHEKVMEVQIAAARDSDLDRLAAEAPRGEALFDALCSLFPHLDGLPAGQISTILAKRGCISRADILVALRDIDPDHGNLADRLEDGGSAHDDDMHVALRRIISEATGIGPWADARSWAAAQQSLAAPGTWQEVVPTPRDGAPSSAWATVGEDEGSEIYSSSPRGAEQAKLQAFAKAMARNQGHSAHAPHPDDPEQLGWHLDLPESKEHRRAHRGKKLANVLMNAERLAKSKSVRWSDYDEVAQIPAYGSKAAGSSDFVDRLRRGAQTASKVGGDGGDTRRRPGSSAGAASSSGGGPAPPPLVVRWGGGGEEADDLDDGHRGGRGRHKDLTVMEKDRTDFEAARLLLELGAGVWHGEGAPNSPLRGREEAKRSTLQFEEDVTYVLRTLQRDHVLPERRLHQSNDSLLS